MREPIDLSNQVFGRLPALEPTDKRSGGSIIWRCCCKCGNIADFYRYPSCAHLAAAKRQAACRVK